MTVAQPPATNLGGGGGAGGGVLDEVARRAAAATRAEESATGAAGTTEALNERALAVMKRMADKLTGRDSPPRSGGGQAETVEEQVVRLILAATSAENLSCSYVSLPLTTQNTYTKINH